MRTSFCADLFVVVVSSCVLQTSLNLLFVQIAKNQKKHVICIKLEFKLNSRHAQQKIHNSYIFMKPFCTEIITKLWVNIFFS